MVRARARRTSTAYIQRRGAREGSISHVSLQVDAQLTEPQPVEIGGVPGWRHRYTYGVEVVPFAVELGGDGSLISERLRA